MISPPSTASRRAASFEAAVEHPDVEAVLLVTPNDLHAEQALACAERGRHVFVEKPIADTLEAGRADARRLRGGRARASRRPWLAPARRRAAREEACSTKARSAQSSSPRRISRSPRSCPRRPGAGTGSETEAARSLQLGIHHADTLRYWLGPVARSHGHVRPSRDARRRSTTSGAVAARVRERRPSARSLEATSPRRRTCSACTAPRPCSSTGRDMSVWPQAELADGATTLS